MQLHICIYLVLRISLFVTERAAGTCACTATCCSSSCRSRQDSRRAREDFILRSA